MTIKVVAAVFVVLVLRWGTCFAEAPQEVGGFVLGTAVRMYTDRLQMESAMPRRHMEYLEEVEIKETAEFKSGLIGYGTCEAPGQIVRIKLKYADSSRKFYNELFERFKKRFGKPNEWRGDSFHVVIAWKWSFTDREKNSISLILQHNTKDEEEKLGNSVKLTNWTAMDKESACFGKKQAGSGVRPAGSGGAGSGQQKVNWDRLIPR